MRKREYFPTFSERTALLQYRSQTKTNLDKLRCYEDIKLEIIFVNTDAKNLNRVLANQIQQHTKKIIPRPSGISSRYTKSVKNLKISIYVTYHIDRIKVNNHMIILNRHGRSV